jgi:hypothetical protein
MAEYNAGSIEGTLDVDTEPFVVGLLRAKQQAEEFERHRYETTLTARTNTDDDRAAQGEAEPKIGADTSEFDRKSAEVTAEMTKLDHTKADPKVDVDTSTFGAKIHQMIANLGEATGSSADRSAGRSGGSGHGMMYLIGAAAAVAPALGPAGAAIVLFGGAAATAFAGAAVSLGLWGAVTKSVLQTIQQATKDGKQLTGAMGAAQKAVAHLSASWEHLQKAAAPGIAVVLTKFADLASSILPRLLPLLNAVSTGLGKVVDQFGGMFAGPAFAKFLSFMQSHALTDLPKVGATLVNTLTGLMNVMVAFGPVIEDMLNWMVKVSGEFSRWSSAKGSMGWVDTLRDFVSKYGPPLVGLLKAAGAAIASLGKGMAPLTGPVIGVLTSLFRAISKIDITPITKFVAALLPQLSAALDKLGPKMAKLMEVIGEILPALLPVTKFILGVFLNSVLGLVDALTNILTGVKDFVTGIYNFFDDLFHGRWSQLWDDVKQIFKGAWEAIKGIFQTAINVALIAPLTKGKAKVGDLMSAISRLPGKIFGPIVGAMKSLWNRIVNSIISPLAKLGAKMRDIGGDIVRGLWNGMKAVWNQLVSWIEGAINSGIIGKFKSLLKLMSPSHVMFDTGANTFLGLHLGLQDVWYRKIQPFLDESAKGLASAFDDVNVALGGGSVSINSSPLQQALGFLKTHAEGIAAHRDDIREALTAHSKDIERLLASMTDEHRKTVIEAFEKATGLSTRQILTALRTA